MQEWRPFPKSPPKVLVATFPTVGEAFDRYFRREKLAWGIESRARFVRDIEAACASTGFDMLATRHSSVTGAPVWVRREENGYGVYADKEAA